MKQLGEYQTRLKQIDADLSAVYRRFSMEAYAAALSVAAAFLIAYLAFVPRVLPRLTVVPFPVWFAYSMRRFRAASLLGRDLRGRKGFYQRGVARLEHHWMGQGYAGDDYAREEHLYARDLELFGDGSVFELLCTTPTAFGHRKLAEWLQAPASWEVVLDRQKAVQQLCDEVDLRAGLSATGDSYALQADTGGLRAWLLQPDRRVPFATRIALVGLTVSLVIAAMLTLAGILAPWSYFLLGTLGAAQLVAGLWMRRRVRGLLEAVSLPSTMFEGLTRVFAYLAMSRPFASQLLARVCAELSETTCAADSLRRLHRLVRILDARNHDLFEYPSHVLLWGTHWSLAIEAWRLEHRECFLRWLDALATFEAVCSLATFADERSESCYPELVEARTCWKQWGWGIRCCRRKGLLATTSR